jgi:hypothetical protein
MDFRPQPPPQPYEDSDRMNAAHENILVRGADMTYDNSSRGYESDRASVGGMTLRQAKSHALQPVRLMSPRAAAQPVQVNQVRLHILNGSQPPLNIE